ncbi:hypothetical protein ACQ4N7_29260 [Nodosilinea sp. AN01ver1]|uniref:hypothetical protein n=1 Tax=Nodosilinea sp. AN01ver1 TaxID=3423362 RepID=UPI003D3202E4
MTAATASSISAEDVQTVIEAILAELGEPATETHAAALEAFHRGDGASIRVFAASNLADSFCRSMGYLISAKQKPDIPTVAVILAEAARAAADYRRDRTLGILSEKIAAAIQ